MSFTGAESIVKQRFGRERQRQAGLTNGLSQIVGDDVRSLTSFRGNSRKRSETPHVVSYNLKVWDELYLNGGCFHRYLEEAGGAGAFQVNMREIIGARKLGLRERSVRGGGKACPLERPGERGTKIDFVREVRETEEAQVNPAGRA